MWTPSFRPTGQIQVSRGYEFEFAAQAEPELDGEVWRDVVLEHVQRIGDDASKPST